MWVEHAVARLRRINAGTQGTYSTRALAASSTKFHRRFTTFILEDGDANVKEKS